LKCVDSETEKYLANSIDILFGYEPVQFVLVFEEHYFCRFLTFGFALVLNYFVILRQLYFIRFDHLCNFRFVGLFKIRQHLHQTDRHLKHALGSPHYLFEFFCVVPQLAIEVYFSSIKTIIASLQC